MTRTLKIYQVRDSKEIPSPSEIAQEIKHMEEAGEQVKEGFYKKYLIRR